MTEMLSGDPAADMRAAAGEARCRSHHRCYTADTHIVTRAANGPLHNWPRCPEGDIRPEAILSRAFGTSRTASHRSVTLFKGPESLHKPKYDFEAPKGFA